MPRASRTSSPTYRLASVNSLAFSIWNDFRVGSGSTYMEIAVDHQRYRSSKMAAMAAILVLVSSS
jgi:hypothetical protein